jgi:hypothetical protein
MKNCDQFENIFPNGRGMGKLFEKMTGAPRTAWEGNGLRDEGWLGVGVGFVKSSEPIAASQSICNGQDSTGQLSAYDH